MPLPSLPPNLPPIPQSSCFDTSCLMRLRADDDKFAGHHTNIIPWLASAPPTAALRMGECLINRNAIIILTRRRVLSSAFSQPDDFVFDY